MIGTSENEEMAKSKKKVETVFLVCEETGDYNYTVRRKPGGEKLKLKKYSPRLRRHTVHNEKKKYLAAVAGLPFRDTSARMVNEPWSSYRSRLINSKDALP